MSCEYTPVLSCALLIIICAEPETTGTLDGFFVDVDEQLGVPSQQSGTVGTAGNIAYLWTLSPFASCCVEQPMLIFAV